MKEIRLSTGQVTIVDDYVFDWAVWFNWRLGEAVRGVSYAITQVRHNGRNVKLYLHKLILAPRQGLHVDHINRNPLDNRVSNLRLATYSQNMANRGAFRGCSSQYKGVRFHRRENKWEARIQANKKPIWLGNFESEIDAALAYNEAAQKYHGEFAVLNEVPRA